MSEDPKKFPFSLEWSALLTMSGILFLFALAIAITAILPEYIDKSWISPSSRYQQMVYEEVDPSVYIGRASTGSQMVDYINHLEAGKTYLAFKESEGVRILTPEELSPFVTRFGDQILRLTQRLLLLRYPEPELTAQATALRNELQREWERENPNWREKNLRMPRFTIVELYDPHKEEAFTLGRQGELVEDYVSKDFLLVSEIGEEQAGSEGTLYVSNPVEYRIRKTRQGYTYDPQGEPIQSLKGLTGPELAFVSRKELIEEGEHTFAIEGCWYCHTDQSRTLVQDSVLNGTETFAAPPSAANEYIYQRITFPGTRRIGPDLARVGVKRSSRDWHRSHFWEPRTASPGSIMPSFRHFFDDDPRGSADVSDVGVPDRKFEAIFQYLMTKGTRITPPTEAWWLGKDPIHTTEILNHLER